MSASIGAALKAYLETQNLGVPVFRDRAPESQDLPYLSVAEEISLVPDRAGDNGAGATGAELVQVDVWQRFRNPVTGAVEEDFTLAGKVQRAIHGGRLDTAPTKVYGLHFVSSTRLIEDDQNILHTALTAEVRKVL